MSWKEMLGDCVVPILARLVPVRLVTHRRYFRVWQRRGLHVTPVNFYQPTPDTRTFTADVFTRASELPGINMNDERQIELLHCLAAFKQEYDALPRSPAGDAPRFYLENKSFCNVDAEVYYAIIRQFKPKHIVEVGAGFSTALASEAISRNGCACELTAIDPYPSPFIPRDTRLIRRKVQDVPLEEFERLEANDILFIDSSHVCSIQSDVVYEICEILPRLRPGVLVHFHDIFLPLNYPRIFVDNRMLFNEQYVLQAFLAFNRAFSVIFAGAYMQAYHPALLGAAFESYKTDGTVLPGSLWMLRTD